jgi:elongation factor P
MEGNARGSAQLRKEGNAAAPKVVGNSFTGCSPCFAYNTPMGGLIGANELKKKMLIEVEGQPYHVLDVFFATPTARGASTMVRTRLKNLLNGSVQEKSFRTNEKFPEPDVEIAVVSFLYSDTNGFHFMDQTSYEQFSIRAESVGDDHFYLKDGILVEVFKYNGAPVSLQLPQYVELQIASTEPGLRGDTAAGGVTKVAKLETGLEVRVPLFMKDGEIVRVNTQTGEVAGRA